MCVAFQATRPQPPTAWRSGPRATGCGKRLRARARAGRPEQPWRPPPLTTSR